MYFPIYYNPVGGKVSLEKQENWIEIYPIKGDGSDGRWRWGKERVSENLHLLVPRPVKKGDKWGVDYKVFLNPALNPMDDMDGEEKLSKTINRMSGRDVFKRACRLSGTATEVEAALT